MNLFEQICARNEARKAGKPMPAPTGAELIAEMAAIRRAAGANIYSTSSAAERAEEAITTTREIRTRTGRLIERKIARAVD